MLVILGALEAFANVTTTATEDYYNTPDVRDRMTREAAQQALEAALDTVGRDGERWLAEGLPSAEEIKQRNNAALLSVQAAKEAADKMQAEEEAHEAEMAADPYGAILIHLDPSRSDAPIFEKVCS
jgi:ABC-type glycerol-3-phosphate transport system substrate-binding protein